MTRSSKRELERVVEDLAEGGRSGDAVVADVELSDEMKENVRAVLRYRREQGVELTRSVVAEAIDVLDLEVAT